MSESNTGDLLRLAKVKKRVGLGKTAIYKRVREGSFPRPIRVTSRAVAWLPAEVDAWVKARVAERDRANSAA
jgi:prophage regulatory protein